MLFIFISFGSGTFGNAFFWFFETVTNADIKLIIFHKLRDDVVLVTQNLSASVKAFLTKAFTDLMCFHPTPR